MDKTCKIFICYRGNNVLLAKNFALYIDKINKDTNDLRNFGNTWYSDFQPAGNYLNPKELRSLIFSAKYFVVFLFKGFTQGFLTSDGEINSECATAQEFIFAEKARQENGLNLLFVNMDGEDFSGEDIETLKQLFLKANIIREDTITAFTKCNKNNHDLRQGNDNELYNRLLSCMNPYINDEIKYKTITDVPDSVTDTDILSTVRKYVLRKTLINEDWDNEITSEFFILCIAQELGINRDNEQYTELIQRISERLTEKVDTGEYSIEKRHNKKLFEENEQIIRLMQQDDDANGEFNGTAYAANTIKYDLNFFYNYFNALFTKVKTIDHRFNRVTIQSDFTFKSLFMSEAFEPFGGWKLYRLPWLTARVLLCLHGLNLNEEQTMRVQAALDSIVERQKENGIWYSGASEWVPEWECTGLCLEALFVYDYEKFKVYIERTINHYKANFDSLFSLINYSTDEDASNKSTAIIILLSVIYQILKINNQQDSAEICKNIRKSLYLALEQIQSYQIKGKQHSCVPCALYYIVKATKQKTDTALMRK